MWYEADCDVDCNSEYVECDNDYNNGVPLEMTVLKALEDKREKWPKLNFSFFLVWDIFILGW